MLTWDDIQGRLLYLLAPAFLTALLVACVTLRWHRGGLAVVAGLLAGNWWFTPVPWWPEGIGWREVFQEAGWHFLLVAALVVTLPFDALGDHRWRTPARRLTAVIWVGVVTILIATSPRYGLHLRLAAGVMSMLLFLISHRAANTLPRWLPLTGWALTSLATAVVLLYAHSGRFCDLGLLLAASLAGVALATVFSRGFTGTGLLPAASLLPALLLAGAQDTYSEVPPASFILLSLAPLAQFLAWALPPRLASRKLTVTVSVLWLACLAIALTLAMKYETIAID